MVVLCCSLFVVVVLKLKNFRYVGIILNSMLVLIWILQFLLSVVCSSGVYLDFIIILLIKQFGVMCVMLKGSGLFFFMFIGVVLMIILKLFGLFDLVCIISVGQCLCRCCFSDLVDFVCVLYRVSLFIFVVVSDVVIVELILFVFDSSMCVFFSLCFLCSMLCMNLVLLNWLFSNVLLLCLSMVLQVFVMCMVGVILLISFIVVILCGMVMRVLCRLVKWQIEWKFCV